MSKKDNIYLIGAASYEDTVEQRLTLYSYIRQLAFLAKHMKTAEDYIHLKRAAAAYGDKAEELFASWDIPGRYLVYGDPGDLDALREETPLERIGTAEDVAESVLFLASEGADFITGQVLCPNGGLII